MADDVQVQFGAAINGLLSGVDQVKSKLGELNSTTESMAAGFGRIGELIAAAFTVEAIERFIDKAVELGVQVERMSAMLGVSTTNIQVMSIAAQMAGGSSETMALAMERLQVSLQHAQNPTSIQAQAFRALGVSVQQMLALKPDQQMRLMADAMSKLADGGPKTAAAMLTMGRGAAGVIPQLNQGSKGMDELREKAIEAGAILTDRTVKAMGDTHQATTLLSSAVASLSAAIVEQMAPALIAAANAASQFAGDMTALIVSGNFGKVLFESLAQLVTTLAMRIITLAVVMADALSLQWGAIAADWKAGTDAIERVVSASSKRIAAMVKEAKDEYRKLLAETKAGGLPNAGNIDVQAAKGAAERLQLAQKESELRVALIKRDYGSFIFNESSKTAALKAELDTRLAAELAAGGQSATKRKIIETQYKIDVTKLYQDEAKAYEGAWNTAFGGVQSAFNSQLKGLLAGTTSFTQAMKAMFGDLVIFAIEQFEKMGAEWLAHQLAMTMVGETQNATRAASDIAATESTLPARIAKFTSDITADAGLVFAGIFANMAPLLGPGAAVPAGAGQAATLAQLANVPKFETGAWQIPRTMGAVVHPGETILPAKAAQTFRDMAAGGGGGHTVIIQALDSVDVHRWVAKNRDALAGAVSHVFTRQRSMRPATA